MDATTNNRFQVIEEMHNTIIRDTVSNLNFAFLAEGGHGVKASVWKLAHEICDWLNREGKKLDLK